MNAPISLHAAASPPENPITDELSDADLEQVIGGLARVWYADAPVVAESLPSSLSISSIVPLETPHRISA